MRMYKKDVIASLLIPTLQQNETNSEMMSQKLTWPLSVFVGGHFVWMTMGIFLNSCISANKEHIVGFN